MTWEQWARVFDAAWDNPKMTKHMPAGDAVAIALDAMARECERIAAEEEQS